MTHSALKHDLSLAILISKIRTDPTAACAFFMYLRVDLINAVPERPINVRKVKVKHGTEVLLCPKTLRYHWIKALSDAFLRRILCLDVWCKACAAL